jgi:hypothetical protein
MGKRVLDLPRPCAALLAGHVAVAALRNAAWTVQVLAVAFGLVVSAPEAAGPAMFLLIFFSYASGAFVPVRTMPGGCASSPGTSRPRWSPRPSGACCRPAGRASPVARAGLVRRHPGRLSRGPGPVVRPARRVTGAQPARLGLAVSLRSVYSRMYSAATTSIPQNARSSVKFSSTHRSSRWWSASSETARLTASSRMSGRS